jgi:hypothetical protein
VLQEQLAIAAGTAEGLKALGLIRPEYVWLPNSASTTTQWLIANGYRQDVQTERSFVAVRTDLPRVMPYIGTSSACFPGP